MRSAVVIGLLVCLGASAQITEGPELDAAKSIVVMIEGKLGEAPVQGAGIVFAAQGDTVYVATAFHVVRRGDERASVRVRFWQDRAREHPADHFPDASSERDVAVLVVQAPGVRFSFNRLSPAPFKETDKAYAIGYPSVSGSKKPWGTTYQPGIVEDVQLVNVSIQTPHIKEGHSGGALIDEGKCLAGMVLRTDGSSAGAARSDQLVEILRRELKVPSVQLGASGGTCGAAGPAVSAAPALVPIVKEFFGLKYVWIPRPNAEFMMGCSAGDGGCQKDETPHPVRLTKGFWMGQTEVTQSAYQTLLHRNPSHAKEGALPVTHVTWEDAAGYCRAIGGRLPTEAEWEYAARAGSRGALPGDVDEIAWHGGNSGERSHPVGTKAPNQFGLHDMIGNVGEWTHDWWGDYGSGRAIDPPGPHDGSFKGIRGSSWYVSYPRVSARAKDYPDRRAIDLGFRCVRDSQADALPGR